MKIQLTTPAHAARSGQAPQDAQACRHAPSAARAWTLARCLALATGLILNPLAARAVDSAAAPTPPKSKTSQLSHAKPRHAAHGKADKADKSGKAGKAGKSSSRKSAASGAKALQGPPYASRDEAMRFADELAERQQLPRAWVRSILGQAHHMPSVVKLMQPPSAPFVKNWRVYRSRFIDPIRIEAGLRFWRTHQGSLERAEKDYGVPAEIIVGILGVETLYGQDMGKFRVIDALTTLAFDFPPTHPRAAERSEFFKREIAQFLSRQHQLGADPLKPLGSYAGAAGMPQFMPSSVVNFAVDFDADGKIDLSGPVDAIGSVANYFKAFNWQPGLATHYPVRFDEARLNLDALLAPDILPTFSVASLAAKGAMLEGPALEHKGNLALVELLNGPDAPSYVAGTDNFYAITRYNWSSYYAMAVIDLAEAVAQKMKNAP